MRTGETRTGETRTSKTLLPMRLADMISKKSTRRKAYSLKIFQTVLSGGHHYVWTIVVLLSDTILIFFSASDFEEHLCILQTGRRKGTSCQ